MKVTVVGPNLFDQSKGSFHAHKAGCADLKRDPNYRGQDLSYTFDADTRDEVGDEIYGDHIAEGSMEPGEGKYDVHFAPCTSGLS